MTNYIGNELELFEHATNWKEYWLNKIKKHVSGDTAEVGAGIGANSLKILNSCPAITSLTSIEPDSQLLEKLIEKTQNTPIIPFNGFLGNLPADKKFNTILYIDVIEHIENDNQELIEAANRLQPGGKLIVLVPAHQYFYSEFDKAIGHYRRYNKKMLKNSAANTHLKLNKMFYLDSVGMASSMANKWFLKQNYPTLQQIKMWDNLIVKTSKLIDPILNYQLGKTLIGIWEKPS